MPKILWFRAKRYGYGWYPVTWQGWLVVLSFVVLTSAGTYVFERNIYFLVEYLTYVAFLSFILIYVCYKTGEKPRWRWEEEDDEKGCK